MKTQMILKQEVKNFLSNNEPLMAEIATVRDGKISTILRQIKDNHINLLQLPVLTIIGNAMGLGIMDLVEELEAE